MRASAAMAQQTLTPEAGAVLKHSIREAQRRGHAHVTPLHVASTLLATGGEGGGGGGGGTDASGDGGGGSGPLLRRACLQSHLHSQHPLQCRALELCFAIALDRLPSSHASPSHPALSNALVAALKRAQAHQRRGNPEQQQLPLLAVKVELEHLILSILDDPSVSRVMREAGFSSPLVKLSLEEATTTATTTRSLHPTSRFLPPPDQSPSLTFLDHPPPRIPSPPDRSTSIPTAISPLDAVVAILLKQEQTNPVLLGDSHPSTQSVVKDFVQRLVRRDIDERLHKVNMVFPQFSGNDSKEEMDRKLSDLKRVVEQFVSTGVVAFLGDLEWLLHESPAEGMNRYSSSRHVTKEIGRLLTLHGGGTSGTGRLWVMATASTQTYFCCRVRYPSLEQQWGLQPLPILSDSTLSPATRLDLPQGMPQTSIPSMATRLMQLLPKSPTSKPKERNSTNWSCCPDSLANFDAECSAFQEREMTPTPESVQSCSPPAKICGTASRRLANSAGFHPWLPEKPDVNLTTGEASMQILQRKCQTRSVKLHDLETEDTSLTLEHTASSNCETGTTIIDPKPAGGSQSFLSLDSNTSLLGSKYQPNRFAEDLDKAWMSLRPHVVEEWNSCKAGKVSEPGALGSVHHPVTNNLYKPQESHEKPGDSESTVQTELALGRPKNPLASLHRDINPFTEGGATPLLELLQGRGKSPKFPDIPPAANNIPLSRELFHASLANFSNAKLSKDLYMLKQQNIPGQLMKETPDTSKRLHNALEDKFPWQKVAVHAIMSRILQCRSGMGRRRGLSFKGDTWLLFLGPNQITKRNIAKFLAKLVYGCEKKFIHFRLDPHDADHAPVTGVRGKSTLDRIAEAVRTQSSSVLLLEHIDKADNMIRRELFRAMKKGKLSDSSGREVSLGNSIIIMTSSLGSEFCTSQQSGQGICFFEERLQAAVGRGMKLVTENLLSGMHILTHTHLSVMEYMREETASLAELINPSRKRKCSGVPVCNGGSKRAKDLMEGQRLELDLNLPVPQLEHILDRDNEFAYPLPSPAECLEERGSDAMLRVVHETLTKDFCELCDEVVVFQSANYEGISNRILDMLSETISPVRALGALFEIDITVLEQLVAAAWEEDCNMVVLKKWTGEVLGQTLSSLISENKLYEGTTLKLVSEENNLHLQDRFLVDYEGPHLTHLPKHISTNSDL